MTAGTKSDFVIYQEEFYGGYTEILEQVTDGFNTASNGAMRLVPRMLKGDYEKESFFKLVNDLVTRRDVTSVGAAADKKLEQGELIGVKVNRKIGPVANTLDSFRKIATDPSEMSFILGQQIGKAVAVDYVNTALASVNAALSGVAALNYDASALSPDTLTHTYLVRGMSKMGDQGSRISALVMHSKSYYDLMAQSIADKVFEVAGVTIYAGTVATFGKPVVVTDSASLIDLGATSSAGDDKYAVLGLVNDAVVVDESEERQIVSDMVTGLENLVMRIQGEYAFNVRVKGFTWDTNTGGVNPTDSALADNQNWDKAFTDVKSLAGFRITTK